MATIEELRQARLKKLELLQEAGMSGFPARTNRTHTLTEVRGQFGELEGKEVAIAGRVMSVRGQGGLLFANLFDGTDTFQVVFKKDEMDEKLFDLFVDTSDIGDFVETKGLLGKTQRGAESLFVREWVMLTKSLRPLPDQHSGFKDTEERLRKRYLDILMNEEVRTIVEKRAAFWKAMRNFLEERGFIEVETPVLETTPGGADAEGFKTHHNALDMDVYLRISCGELWQKRLMVAGLPKVFEIGRIFRNEGMSAEHLQDYTQMEFYWGYADYKKGMELVRDMYRYIAEQVLGTQTFTVGEHTIDLSSDWVEYDFVETIEKETGINVLDDSFENIVAKLNELKVEYSKEGFNKTRAVDTLWKWCRKKISGPGFLVNVPVEVEPLAKRKEDDPRKVERFQVLLAGSEVGKGYSELNDPIDQAGRFREQQALRDAGDSEAQMEDKEFVEALEYGMPPTCGFGVSERLFAFLMNKPVRETQIFPLVKPKE